MEGDKEDEFGLLVEESKGGGWEFVSRHGNVTISKKTIEGDSRVSCFRGQAIVEFPPEIVAQLILDNALQTKLNPQLQSSTVLKKIDDSTRVLHKVFRAKKCAMTIHRDVVFLERQRKMQDDTLVVLATSKGADQDAVACPDKCIRAEVHISGWVLEPWVAKGGKMHCNACYLIQSDLKGLPVAILELAGREQPLVLNRIQEQLANGLRGCISVKFE